MEATLETQERLPPQNRNTYVTGTTDVSHISGGTKVEYDSHTSEIVNIHLQKKYVVVTHHQDEEEASSENEIPPAKLVRVKLRDLAEVFENTAAPEFYCPKCEACISEVLIGDNEGKLPSLPPIRWPELTPNPRPDHIEEARTRVPPLRPTEERIRCTSCFHFIGDWIFRREPTVPIEQVITVQDEIMPILPARGETDNNNNKRLEIIKSFVYGGLVEAIASLSIVTSAASAATPTLNIFVLALANLLGGLLIIGHNLWEMKADQVETKYLEILGNKANFIIHAPITILSFLIFGLVPPLVYAFSFSSSDNTDLKIAAVAGASLICIIILAIGKAYIQTPPKYIKTVMYYVVVGVGASGVSYLAGDLIEKLAENFGWFSSTLAGGFALPN